MDFTSNNSEPLRESSESTSKLSYKGPVAGLRGLLTSRIAEGLANVATTIDKSIDKIVEANKQLDTAHLLSLPLEKIYPCPTQPRQYFDTTALEELAKTLSEIGQAQAITVRKTEQGYEIIGGERRYRAAKLAGLKTLDCLVKDCTIEEGRLLALVENTQRQDLLPVEEAFYLKQVLADSPGMSLEKLAKKIGTHKSTVSEKMQLAEIPEDLLPMLYTPKGSYFTHRHWRVISRIQDVAYLRTVFTNAIENNLSVAELEKSLAAAGIKKALRHKASGASKVSAPVYYGIEQLKNADFKCIEKTAQGFVQIKPLSFDVKQLSTELAEKLKQELRTLLGELDAIEV